MNKNKLQESEKREAKREERTARKFEELEYALALCP